MQCVPYVPTAEIDFIVPARKCQKMLTSTPDYREEIVHKRSIVRIILHVCHRNAISGALLAVVSPCAAYIGTLK